MVRWLGRPSWSTYLWVQKARMGFFVLYLIGVWVFYTDSEKYGLLFFPLFFLSVIFVANFWNFLKNIWILRGTTYAVTNHRVLVILKRFGTRVRSIFPSDFNGVEIVEGAYDGGSIRLTVDRVQNGSLRRWPVWAGGSSAVLLEMAGIPRFGDAVRAVEALKRKQR